MFSTSTNKENEMAKYKYPFGTGVTWLPKIIALDRCALSVINMKPIKIKKDKPKI